MTRDSLNDARRDFLSPYATNAALTSSAVEAPGKAGLGLAGEIVESAQELEGSADFPGDYVRQVRSATGALGVSAAGDDPVRQAALLLEYQAAVDIEAPVRDPRRSRRLVKGVIRKLIGWYIRFLGDQINVVGRTAARLGLATAERLERLDADHAALRAEVNGELARLRARVAELESRREGGSGR